MILLVSYLNPFECFVLVQTKLNEVVIDFIIESNEARTSSFMFALLFWTTQGISYSQFLVSCYIG